MTRDARSSLVLALLAALLVLVITISSDVILEHTQPSSFWPYLFDDLFMSALFGAMVWFYERRRLRELGRKLHVISEMNHRVRNQLEVIQYSAYSTKEKEHIAIIGESVAKIEAALSEILGHRKSTAPKAAGKEQ